MADNNESSIVGRAQFGGGKPNGPGPAPAQAAATMNSAGKTIDGVASASASSGASDIGGMCAGGCGTLGCPGGC